MRTTTTSHDTHGNRVEGGGGVGGVGGGDGSASVGGDGGGGMEGWRGTDGQATGGYHPAFFSFFTIALLSAGAEDFASIVTAREGRRESSVTMATSIPLTHTTSGPPLGTH